MIVVCSMKMLRCSFSDAPKQYLVLTFTYFFFKYDYRTSSETFIVDYFFMTILFYKVLGISRLALTCFLTLFVRRDD